MFAPVTTRRRPWTVWGPLLATLWVGGWGGNPALASAEDEIKSAFALNIARYVRWSVEALEASPTFVFCALGDLPWNGGLKRLSGRLIHGREIELRSVPDMAHTTGCLMLFVPAYRLEEQALEPPRPNLLTLTDLTDSNDLDRHQGSTAIALYREGSRIRIAIHRGRTRAAGLTLSSELLKLSRLLDEEDR